MKLFPVRERDAGVAGGHFKVDNLQQTHWDKHIGFVAAKLLPVFLRLIIGAVIIRIIFDAAVAFPADKTSETIVLLAASMPLDMPMLPVLALTGLMIITGFMARSIALLIAVFVAGNLPSWDAPFNLFFLLACTLILTLTGSGSWSLWQPEDRLILERQGKGCRADL